MAVRDSVFGSKSEGRGYRTIEHTWGDKYRLFSQLPMSAVFSSPPDERNLRDFFLKTSLDYVLCTKEGRPLMAIDYDGLGRGFDREGEYVQVEPTKDRNRKWKFDFKLEYAQEHFFPYHVVASEEFDLLGEGVQLTVVDGIIGSTMAREEFKERAPVFLEEHSESIDGQPPSYRSEYIDDLLIGLELDCAVEHNPIMQKTFEVMTRVRSMVGEAGICNWQQRYFEEPECPTFNWPPESNWEAFQRRLEALKKVECWGCVVTLLDTPAGDVSSTAKVRNVTHSLSYLSDIAELLAYSKLLRLLQG